ncbi:hypothetical protein PCI56_13555 [Plesiomonas shigelloides subsp. oncorhynchi]|nr:hypothetical protein [Plesiomonas shigelloides]
MSYDEASSAEDGLLTMYIAAAKRAVETELTESWWTRCPVIRLQ